MVRDKNEIHPPYTLYKSINRRERRKAKQRKREGRSSKPDLVKLLASRS
jgi:hypothetical protein